jgi:preprotein translocase subunit YajC
MREVILDIVNIGFMLAFGAILWFGFVKPELDKSRTHEELLGSLAKDDLVVTSSGVHGKIVRVSDETLLLEIAEKTRVTIEKKSVARRQGEEAAS